MDIQPVKSLGQWEVIGSLTSINGHLDFVLWKWRLFHWNLLLYNPKLQFWTIRLCFQFIQVLFQVYHSKFSFLFSFIQWFLSLIRNSFYVFWRCYWNLRLLIYLRELRITLWLWWLGWKRILTRSSSTSLRFHLELILSFQLLTFIPYV